MTIAEQLIEKGREEGRVEGREAGLRLTLRRLLERRFGVLSPAAGARIDAATGAQLDAWLDVILVAPTLDALLDVTPSPVS